jgi:cytidylate kinase
MGSLGDEIAHEMSRRLGWVLLDHNQMINRFFTEGVTEHERQSLSESARFFLNAAPDGQTYIDRLERGLNQLATEKPLILLGFGSQIIFAENDEAVHVRITAPATIRLERVKNQFNATDENASQILDQADRRHRRFVSTLFDVDSTDESLYHLVLNTGFLSVAEAVETLSALLNIKKIMHEQPKQPEKPVQSANGQIHFKNKSEAEFARILDMHQIEWKYEPRTFPVEWDAEGNVTLAFSPDFYLVQFDTYLELTTMNQRYVTEKNKKLRRVRELYPGTHIKIVYKRDFQTLIERFSHMGTTSQL